MLIVEPLGMMPSHPQETGDRFFPDVFEAGRGTDATAFTQMADNILSVGLRELGFKQGSAPSLRELLPTGATA